MAVISFWNALEKATGQTSSIIAIATQMAIEHNYRILIIDATFKDQTMEKAFWKDKKTSKALQELTGGKLDISSGAEGLVSAVASNKATPEIITNYTKIVFKNRLDVLLGLKTEIREEHENSMMLYKDLITAASKFYDLVLVDLSKGLSKPSTKVLLEKSNIIAYTMPPNLMNIDYYKKLKQSDKLIASSKVLPILARSDESSSYNVKNTTRYIKEKETIATVPYNVRFMEATNESRTAEFFTKAKLSKSSYEVNENFYGEVQRACSIIINKIKELNL